MFKKIGQQFRKLGGMLCDIASELSDIRMYEQLALKNAARIPVTAPKPVTRSADL